MVTTFQAKELMKNNPIYKDKELVHVKDAVNRISFEKVIATSDVRKFDTALFDGYLVCLDTMQEGSLEIDETQYITAGSHQKRILDMHKAIPINTGGIIDIRYDTVIKYEDVLVEGNKLVIKKKTEVGHGIEKKGSLLKQGDMIVDKYMRIEASNIEKLIMSGIHNICVLEKPQVGILSVGDEICPIQGEMYETHIYPSNAYYIYARLQEKLYDVNEIRVSSDNLGEIIMHMDQLLETNDFVITVGGCGYSNKDMMRSWIKESEFEILYNELDVGKKRKMIYSRKNNKAVMCLSGNPFAMKECFELLAWTMLESIVEGDICHV